MKFVYLIRTEAQANPGNYEGVDTPEEDPLSEDKLNAKKDITEYINNIDKDDYLIHSELFDDILAEAKEAIANATTEDDIISAVEEAITKIINIPPDSYIDEAKILVEEYVDINIYDTAAPIVANAFAAIESATRMDEIDAIVEDTYAEIDAAVLSDVISDKMAALDDFVAALEIDLSEDDEFSALVDELKLSFISITTVTELNEVFEEAISAIEIYVSELEPVEPEPVEPEPVTE